MDSLVGRLLPIGLFLNTFSATAVNLGPALSSISPVFGLSCILNLLNSLVLLPLMLHLATNKKQREEAGLPLAFIARLYRVLALAIVTGSPRATLTMLILCLEQDGLIDQVLIVLSRWKSETHVLNY